MSFEKLIEEQKFSDVLEAFDRMNQIDKEKALKILYYKARNAKTPVAVSILHRRLHEGKTFEDFFNSWIPPKDSMRPFSVGSATYHQHFEIPVRVINAINLNDSKDVISVGLVWCTEEEFKIGIKKAEESQSNAERGENISEVADKESIEIYMVKADTNLGT
jgi:hypothetical protein